MFKWLRTILRSPRAEGGDRRAVPGAAAFRDRFGRVVYNALDPTMQQFLGRSVGAIKKAGIRAKGTGQFSVLLGESQSAELILDPFWKKYCGSKGEEGVFAEVVATAREMLKSEGGG